MKTRVVLADDHALFVQAMAQLLAPTYDVVDIVGDGRSLQVSARTHKPDVIVTDVTMPLLGGMESVRLLSKDSQPPKVVFLTMHAEPELARECFNCGGSAFVTKESGVGELIAAIDTVMSNQLYLSSNIAGGLIEALRGESNGSEPEHLTCRQREMLQMFAEGKSMKEIACDANLSTRTVEWHKYQLMRILRVRSSAELVQRAVRMKLVI